MIGLYFLRLYRRTLAAGSVLALAWWIIGAPPYAATALTKTAPQFTVNQFRKGDHLWHDMLAPPNLQSGKKLPLGCDPVVFLESVYGRCIV